MTMFGKVKMAVRALMVTCIILTWFAIVQAAGTAPAPDTITSKDIIMILFGLLQTMFMGIGIWLISNDKELFTRMGKVESNQATRDAICDERNTDGEHHHNRASDKDTQVALKESIDMLRRALHSMAEKGETL